MVAKYNETSESQIEEIFKEAGIKCLKRDDNIYKLAGLNPKGLNTSMVQLLSATAKKTNNNLSNLTMTTANTSQHQFINAMNKAYMETSTGVKSYSQSIIDTVKEISDKGAYIEYPSGQHRSLESAVRTNVLTSVNQTSGKLQLMRAEEMNCDLMELSAHSGARPEHAEWQGKVVSRSGKKGYLSLDDIGYGDVTGFQGVNCRHTWFPYYEGETLTYTDKELEELNNETVTYNNKKISKYDASQIQRKMERQIRTDKKDIAGLEGILLSNNDEELINETRKKLIDTKNKLNQDNTVLNDFVMQTGFKKDNNRLFVGNISTKINNNDKITKNIKNEVKNVQYIGKIDKAKIGIYKDKIITDRVMISKERIQHIKEHHPELKDEEVSFIKDIIKNPDYVFKDRKNVDTILMAKEIIRNNKNYISVVKLNTNKEYKDKSNTIISFWNISQKKLGQFIRNEEIIYRKLDKNE